MEVSGQLHAPAVLPQGNSPWYPLDRRLFGTQSWSRRGGEEKNSQPLPGLKPPIFQPVARRYTTELSRLLKMCWGLSEICFSSHNFSNRSKCFRFSLVTRWDVSWFFLEKEKQVITSQSAFLIKFMFGSQISADWNTEWCSVLRSEANPENYSSCISFSNVSSLWILETPSGTKGSLVGIPHYFLRRGMREGIP
jgi:hypothetical protein